MPLGSRSYDIIIGESLLGDKAGRLVAGLGGRVLMVSNRKVFGLYGRRLGEGLTKAGVKWEKLLLPDGEEFKTMETAGRIHDRLVEGKYDRDCLALALGGGVIGDITGFAAATYMRGVRFAQAPTTLLAQVDSSVGGKTGVNHPKGKNLIGAFHQPSLVISDVGALATLPEKEVLGGVAEVIKYGCIGSAGFFRYLEKHVEELVALQPGVTAYCVEVSCRMKAEIVGADERESGLRAILNFGHTAGHAVEAVTRYKRFTHGHAVAMGMAVAASLSRMKGGLGAAEAERVISLIRRAGLPAEIPRDIEPGALLAAMERDKKAKAGVVRFALLDGIGKCSVRGDVTRGEVLEALRERRRGG